MAKTQAIKDYLERREWFGPVDAVSFLAAGEYNENYLVESDGRRAVFRINHGSQLQLENQIQYEFQVLQAVEPSGVTPRPYFCDPAPEALGGGVLLMEYVPGRPLDYGRDSHRAAHIFARIHSLPPAPGLVVQEHPVRDIAAESYGLLTRFDDHPLDDVRSRLFDYYETVMRLAEETATLYAGEPLCIVNTEVNSGNFLVGPDAAYLVDWEKAVVSFRYQDLGHFVVPTTTRWKADYTYTAEEKRRFLEHYRDRAGLGLSLGELVDKTLVMERTILLRALSWCFMAYYEYTRTPRALQNRDTYRKIQEYLRDAACFLE